MVKVWLPVHLGDSNDGVGETGQLTSSFGQGGAVRALCHTAGKSCRLARNMIKSGETLRPCDNDGSVATRCLNVVVGLSAQA